MGDLEAELEVEALLRPRLVLLWASALAICSADLSDQAEPQERLLRSLSLEWLSLRTRASVEAHLPPAGLLVEASLPVGTPLLLPLY